MFRLKKFIIKYEESILNNLSQFMRKNDTKTDKRKKKLNKLS